MRADRCGGFNGSCPVHGGRSGKFFSLKVSDSGKLLLHCFNGCTYRELYESLVERDLLPAKAFEIPEIVMAVSAAAQTHKWAGRTGSTDLVVLLAHITIAKRCNSDTYGASVRELAEIAKIGIYTVSSANRRLEKAGWLVPEEKNWDKATIWRLQVPHGERVREQIDTLRISMGLENVSTYSHPISMSHAEAFRHRRGLGKTAGRVYGAVLGEFRPITAYDVAAALGLNKRSVEIALNRLRVHSMMRRVGRDRRTKAIYWWLGPKNEFDVARELELSGETERQHKRHAEQRAAFQIHTGLKRGSARMADDGSIVDEETGEVLLDARGNRPGSSGKPTEAPSGYVEIGDSDDLDAAERFLVRLGGRVTEKDGRRIVEPPPQDARPRAQRVAGH